ncbi:enoyl-CoA hydratase/isomerase family protein [Nocardioides sp.]|uniref:enoyl-CoA hydratase/isomerase family protein n=1 Tax=Nocardioides sp. TaxID=35761 RepID=UPI003D0F3877
MVTLGDDRVARIELNRPAVANSFDLGVARELAATIRRISLDDQIAAVLVTGRGPRFCAGGDLGSMMGAPDPQEFVEELALVLDDALQQLAALGLPVVAAVHGAVAGAGLALMLSCDLVVAAESTRFVSAYLGVGLTPDCGLSYLLPRAVGQQRALELALTRRSLTAAEAQQWGMVSEVVPDGAVHERGLELARQLTTESGMAVAAAKRLMRDTWTRTRGETGAVEAKTIAEALDTDTARALIVRRLGQS